jgi:RHS repeat-associated protein
MKFLLQKNTVHFLCFIPCLALFVVMNVQAQTTSLFMDGSLTAKTVSAYGDANVVAGQSKFTGPVGTFDGAGDYLVVSPSPLDASPKVFTIETWVYMSSIPANGWPIVSQSAAGAASEQQLFVSGTNGGAANQNKLRFSRGADATNAIDLIGTTTLPLNQWVHVALSVDGVTAKLFVNGNLDASAALTSGWVDTAQAFYVATTLNTSAPQNQSFANGKISDLRVTKGATRYTSSFMPGLAELIDQTGSYDPNWVNDSLLMVTNGGSGSTVFNDVSHKPKRITTGGNAQTSTSQSKFGSSAAYFDGSGDYLGVSDSVDFQLSGDFTIEAWLYPTAFPAGSGTIVTTRRDTNSVKTPVGLWISKEGKMQIAASLSGSQYDVNLYSTSSVMLNQWSHVAATRSGNVWKIFINGEEKGSVTSVITPYTRTGTTNIGGDTNTNYFTGYIDDLRITKGVARYTTSFTPIEIPKIPIKIGDAQWSNVPFLLNANGTDGSKTFANLAASSQNITASGDAKIATGQSKFSGASAYFDGSSDYVRVPDYDDFQLNRDFTIEAWLYPTAFPSGSGTIVTTRRDNNSVKTPVGLWISKEGKMQIASSLTSSQYDVNLYSTSSLMLNQWSHVAATRSGNLWRIFINGEEKGSVTSAITPYTRAGTTNIGGDTNTNYFTGHIDDLRITKGVARYTANFTPPTAQLEPPRFVKDPYTSRVSLLLLSGAAAPDEIPPYVTTTSKQTNTSAALESITVNFSKAMEPTSITSAQFTVTDAAQQIFPVSSITRVSSTSFKLGFMPALLTGTYKVKAWQDILGANGLALDQNKNGIGGELADAFEQSIVVSSAAPSAITPTVISAGTRTGISVSWPAYVKPLNGKDIAKYRIYVSTTPYTNISQATKVLEVTSPATEANVTGLLSNTTYYVSVVAVDVDGKFTSAVTPIVAKTQDVTEQSTSYTYNAAGQILTEDGPRTDVNDITTYTYDAAGNRATMTNALGHIVRYNSYDGAGHLLSMTDANGITTEFSYHDSGWLLSSRIKHPSNNAMDNLTTYSYDAVGLMIGMTLPNGYQLTYEYDDARRLTAIQNTAGERIEYAVDLAGNRTQQSIKNNAGTIVYSVAQAFDELSRVMAITGNNNQNEKHQYDANDNTTAVTDGRNNKTQQTYDALNRVAKVIDPDLKETQFTYDTQNRIKTVTDARGNTTTYNYDGLGNLISQSSPDTGITRFSYDAVGNRTTAVDARGVVVNYSYDALNRLKSVVYPAATAENVTYTYDVTATGNYGIGRLNKAAIGSTSVAYTYNHLGLISKKTSVVNSLSKSVAYAYDKAGNLTSMTYPSGRIVNYTRDAAGRVQAVKTKVNSSTAEQTVVSAVNYLPFGPAKSYTYGNGLTHTVSYDNDYRLTDIVLGGLMVRNYSYDAADNITNIIDGVSATKTQNFTYDNLDRLTSANGTYGYQAFGYDGVGNRTDMLFDNGTSIQSDTYTYEATSNRLSRIDKTNAGLENGIRNFTYDSAGNLVQGTADDGSAQTYTLNNANRLTTANVNTALVGTYSYNALGQRVSKTYADATKELFHYNEAGQLLAVTNAAGTSVREYIYNDSTLVGYVNAGILIYVHNDHLNTPQVITAQNQSVLWMADYEPFGKAKLNSNNTIAFSARFPGQYLDSETGLYYNYFRDYDPSIGRYIESDPIGILEDYSEPQMQIAITMGLMRTYNDGSMLNHSYSYALNNPAGYADPFGLSPGGSGMSQRTPEQCSDDDDDKKDDKDKNCKKLRDNIINQTCKSIANPKKKFACFAAAWATYASCLAED